MNATHSKSTYLYKQIRRALRSGRYLPGQRIDPATIAAEHHTSPTPVRFALHRLVGEGLIADHARAGLHVPLPTEVALRDRYDWMQRLLLMACDIGQDGKEPDTFAAESAVGDGLVKRTWQLFDAIARASGHRSLYEASTQANDRLAPVRHAKPGLIDGAAEELAVLERHWRQRDLPALRIAVSEYHEIRKRQVPRIVAALSNGRDYPY